MDEAEREGLVAACRQLPEPDNYYLGHTGALAALPENVLLFSRRRLPRGHELDFQHYRFVLIVNLRTAGELCLNERLLPLDEGAALLIFPHQLHHFLTLEVDLDWLFVTFEHASPESLLPLRNRPARVSGEGWAHLRALVRAYGPPTASRPLILRLALLLEALMAAEPAAASEPEPPAAAGQTLLIERLNRTIYQRMESPLTLADLAREVHLSPSRLGALFRRHMGMGPGRYVRLVKLNRAARLLCETRLDVTEVAARTGFASIHAFSRAFRELLGVPPSAYRRRMGK